MENVSLFEGLGKSIERKKGDLLFKQGEKDNSIYIVKHGLLKAFYLTLDGKELIKSFIQPGEFIGSLIACYLDEPGTFNLMCLEDSSLQRVSFTELQQSAAGNPQAAGAVINSLISLAIKKERREYEFLCLSAPERFALIKQPDPELVAKLTQNDIARYLGITPVALSRIKQRQSGEG